ncbi:MAG: indolepyruvate oxidoreductase subunit beta [Sphaerochaetaceae bacterium]|jgi:indolepyruvate ferredoxin oxidoreductase beta subunit|nr:indolepyruvate oxidoreductase subunit beta [Sphaerochaetaceae bacterium]
MTSMLIVGVGGQGAILFSKILTEALVEKGYDVKMSEVHGMAQRGGSVSTQVRFGKKVLSPIIGLGEADILVSLEEMESARYCSYLKPGAIAIINRYRLLPGSLADGKESYPEGIVDFMSAHFETHLVEAAAAAQALGNSRCMNLVLLGAMSNLEAFKDLDWETVIRRSVPQRLLDLNLKAFEAGRALPW